MALRGLQVFLSLNSERFAQGLKKATKAANVSSDGIKKAFLGTTAAIAGAVAGVAVAVGKTAQTLDMVGKRADSLGVTTEQLIGLTHAAEQGGANFEVLASSMRRLERRTVDAAKGNKTLRRAFTDLNIDLESFAQLDPAQKFRVLADAVKDTENPAVRIKNVFALMDVEGSRLIPTLLGGAEGLDRLQEEAERLGLTVSRSTIGALEHFHDSMDFLQKITVGVTRQLTAALAPALKTVGILLRDSGFDVRQLREQFDVWVENAVVGLAWVLDNLELFSVRVRQAWIGLQTFMIDMLGRFTNFPVTVLSSMRRRLSEDFDKLGADAVRILEGVDTVGRRIIDTFEKARAEIRAAQATTPDVTPGLDVEAIADKIKKVKDEALSLQELMRQTMSTIAQDIGNTVGQIFSMQEGLESLGKLAQRITSLIVSTFVRFGVELALTQALIKATGAAAAASAATAGSAMAAAGAATAGSLAAAWGPAAVAASIATLGAAAGVGLGAYLAALTAGTAATIASQVLTSVSGAAFKGLTGQAHAGLPYVPKTGTYLLERGERVVPKDENRPGMLGGQMNVTINNNAALASVSARPGVSGLEVFIEDIISVASARSAARFEASLARGTGTFNRALTTNYRAGRRRG